MGSEVGSKDGKECEESEMTRRGLFGLLSAVVTVPLAAACGGKSELKEHGGLRLKPREKPEAGSYEGIMLSVCTKDGSMHLMEFDKYICDRHGEIGEFTFALTSGEGGMTQFCLHCIEEKMRETGVCYMRGDE